MKVLLPIPDQTLTGTPALKALRGKSKRDRKIFNQRVDATRKGSGSGVSIFAIQKHPENETIHFDLGLTHPDRVDGLDFTILRYTFPDSEEGELEAEFNKGLIEDALKGGAR